MKKLLNILFLLSVAFQSSPAISQVLTYGGNGLVIAEGGIPGRSIALLTGHNHDIDTASVPADVWSGTLTYTGFPLTDDELLEVVSASVNDVNTTGSGAWKVHIFGLDSNFLRIDEVVNLNGTTPVDTVNTYRRVYKVSVVESASSNQAANDGDLSIRHTTTVANIFAVVKAGEMISESTNYTIPANEVGVLRTLHLSVDKAQATTGQGALWHRRSGESWHLLRRFAFSETANRDDHIWGGLLLEPLTDLIIRVISCSSNNTEISGSLDISMRSL